MELFINIIVYIFACIGLLITFITISCKYIIIDENIENKNFKLRKNRINVRYKNKKGDKNVFVFKR